MNESVIQVNGLITAGCARSVEKALSGIPGVHHASANYLNSTATVHYDETRVSLARLQDVVADCGYVCAGESTPEHMHHTAPAMDQRSHADHAAHGALAPAPPGAHAGHEMAGSMEDHSAHGGQPSR